MLARMAMWIVFARFVDVFFLIAPEFYDGGLTIHWMDAAAVVGNGASGATIRAQNSPVERSTPARNSARCAGVSSGFSQK